MTQESVPLLVVDGRPWAHFSTQDLERHLAESASLKSAVQILNSHLRVEAECRAKLAQKMFVPIGLLIEMICEGAEPIGALALRDDLVREVAAFSLEDVL